MTPVSLSTFYKRAALRKRYTERLFLTFLLTTFGKLKTSASFYFDSLRYNRKKVMTGDMLSAYLRCTKQTHLLWPSVLLKFNLFFLQNWMILSKHYFLRKSDIFILRYNGKSLLRCFGYSTTNGYKILGWSFLYRGFFSTIFSSLFIHRRSFISFLLFSLGK